MRRRMLSLTRNTQGIVMRGLERAFDLTIRALGGSNDEPDNEKECEEATFEHEELFEINNTAELKILAFYFPQFHPFPENDQFWGKGFTEWTNVTKARPLFNGHYQPRLPGELGFYDLRIKEVMERQIELAKNHGVYGFCFHHYWFTGRRVMRVPYNHMLNHPDLDIPFCLHWANEPWTVRWDGCLETGTLLAQDHNPQDDLAFIQDITLALADSRYIRINGRPLLIIYRPGLFPDMEATIDRWRNYCAKNSVGELYLAVMQNCFDGIVDPRDYGFDAAIEYPPHNCLLVPMKHNLKGLADEFQGNIFSYEEMATENATRQKRDYKQFRGIIPDWDCTPRVKNPMILVGSTPQLYQHWLEQQCRFTINNHDAEERFVFINAWNEWAEGAYLEPDSRFGYAYLNATGRALNYANVVAKVELDQPISFAANGTGLRLIKKGFSRPENHWVWTDGYESSIICNILATGSDLELILKATPFAKREWGIDHNCEVSIGGHIIAKWHLTEENGLFKAAIDKGLISRRGPTQIQFTFDKLLSPEELKLSNDSRKLGLAFKEIIFQKLQ